MYVGREIQKIAFCSALLLLSGVFAGNANAQPAWLGAPDQDLHYAGYYTIRSRESGLTFRLEKVFVKRSYRSGAKKINLVTSGPTMAKSEELRATYVEEKKQYVIGSEKSPSGWIRTSAHTPLKPEKYETEFSYTPAEGVQVLGKEKCEGGKINGTQRVTDKGKNKKYEIKYELAQIDAAVYNAAEARGWRQEGLVEKIVSPQRLMGQGTPKIHLCMTSTEPISYVALSTEENPDLLRLAYAIPQIVPRTFDLTQTDAPGTFKNVGGSVLFQITTSATNPAVEPPKKWAAINRVNEGGYTLRGENQADGSCTFSLQKNGKSAKEKMPTVVFKGQVPKIMGGGGARAKNPAMLDGEARYYYGRRGSIYFKGNFQDAGGANLIVRVASNPQTREVEFFSKDDRGRVSVQRLEPSKEAGTFSLKASAGENMTGSAEFKDLKEASLSSTSYQMALKLNNSSENREYDMMLRRDKDFLTKHVRVVKSGKLESLSADIYYEIPEEQFEVLNNAYNASSLDK